MKMIRTIFVLMLVVGLLFVAGCSSNASGGNAPPPPPGPSPGGGCGVAMPAEPVAEPVIVQSPGKAL